ncbi:hypothetical protein B0D71_30260 [Pseudomonas laurylsulfativorans]|uniref:Uncharacterized protein n=1 Tax=Pseudomonas laurylsulfativorans TaxID=1943631 RepID=A0A2S3VF82_9PSED|nr:hypothetical protein B0D71_30260 [Pseudomonas laurylsulfativorans]
MGAGLLAKAACQSTSMLNVRPLSRASPLPQKALFQTSERITSPNQSMNTLTRNGKCRCRA